MNKELYELLKSIAQNKQTITYGEAMEKIGLEDMREFEKLLEPIELHEKHEGRPMLTVIIVMKEVKPRMPGDGFFRLAKEIGNLKDGQDRWDFYIKELNKVFDFWKKQ